MDRLCVVIVVWMVLRAFFIDFPWVVWLFVIVVTWGSYLLFMLEILVLASRMGNQNSFVFVSLLKMWLIMMICCLGIERKNGFRRTVNVNETFARGPLSMRIPQFLIDFFRNDLLLRIMMLRFMHWRLSLHF